jgi:hypothetical protein
MKKITLILLLVILVAVAAGAVLWNNIRHKTAQNASVGIDQSLPQKTAADLENLFTDPAIAKYAFAVTNAGICFIKEDFSLNYYEFAAKKAAKISSAGSGYQSAQIESSGDACLAQYFAAQNKLQIFTNGKVTDLNVESTAPADQNLGFYSVYQEKSIIILEANGQQKAKIENNDQNIYKAVAVSSDKQVLISNYDWEAKAGKLAVRSGNSSTVIKSVENVYAVRANQSAIMVIYQDGSSFRGELVDYRGKVKATVRDIDPSSVDAQESGFYFATKPGDLDINSNFGGGLGFIANSGETKNILSSVEETEQQYSFANVQVVGEYLYASEGEKVVRIKI